MKLKRKAIKETVDAVRRTRGYDDYPADYKLYKEMLNEVADDIIGLIKEVKASNAS